MREAVGGTLLFYIVITFLFIYIIFIGFIMNYASAYRASNHIISRIEEMEANIDVDNSDFIDEIREKYNYHNSLAFCCKNNAKGSVYQLTASIAFELPLIGLDFKIPFTTETKTIYGISCDDGQIKNTCIANG